jgi:hypothetical protein
VLARAAVGDGSFTVPDMATARDHVGGVAYLDSLIARSGLDATETAASVA